MIDKISIFLKDIRNRINIILISYNSKYKCDRFAAELLRNVHSIEKGLSIKSPRLGFGYQKHLKMIEQIKLLNKNGKEMYNEHIKMAIDVLEEYIIYHEENNYKNNHIEMLKRFVEMERKQIDDYSEKFGGTIFIDNKNINFNIEEIEKFFKSRHSIRDFEDSEVDIKKIEKALELAKTAPSACNRQGTRIYVFNKDKLKDIKGGLAGIGGFSNEINKFVLITAKLSSYRNEEVNQYIVSSSIYAAYLSLTLHLYGLGACIIQRPVIYNNEWNELRKKWKIPEDEQIICLLGIGNLKESYKVPVSHRLSNDFLIKYL